MIMRSLLLLIPLALWTALFINPGIPRKEITASFLGFVWAFISGLILNSFFIQQGLLNITISDNLFYGVPLDWVFAQAIILGSLIPLCRILGWSKPAQQILQVVAVVLLYYTVGLVFFTLNNLVILISSTLLVAMPARMLSAYTANDSHIRIRSALQALAWASLLLWFFPSTVFYLTSDNWFGLLQRDLIVTAIYCLPLLIPAGLLISALYQFATEGNGTAFPYDPPKNLVTGGIYQYISNPMQLGICLMMGWWGVVIQSMWIFISALIALVLFIVFKDVCNGSCAIGNGNPQWESYQQAVPKWIPKLTANYSAHNKNI